MNQRVAEKLDMYLKKATTPVKPDDTKPELDRSAYANDGLSKGIRNEKEAKAFLAELDAVIKAAQEAK